MQKSYKYLDGLAKSITIQNVGWNFDALYAKMKEFAMFMNQFSTVVSSFSPYDAHELASWSTDLISQCEELGALSPISTYAATYARYKEKYERTKKKPLVDIAPSGKEFRNLHESVFGVEDVKIFNSYIETFRAYKRTSPMMKLIIDFNSSTDSEMMFCRKKILNREVTTLTAFEKRYKNNASWRPFPVYEFDALSVVQGIRKKVQDVDKANEFITMFTELVRRVFTDIDEIAEILYKTDYEPKFMVSGVFGVFDMLSTPGSSLEHLTVGIEALKKNIDYITTMIPSYNRKCIIADNDQLLFECILTDMLENKTKGRASLEIHEIVKRLIEISKKVKHGANRKNADSGDGEDTSDSDNEEADLYQMVDAINSGDTSGVTQYTNVDGDDSDDATDRDADEVEQKMLSLCISVPSTVAPKPAPDTTNTNGIDSDHCTEKGTRASKTTIMPRNMKLTRDLD